MDFFSFPPVLLPYSGECYVCLITSRRSAIDEAVQIGSKCSITEIHIYYKPTDNHAPGSHLTHTSVNLNPPVSNLLSLIHQICNDIF